MPGIPRRRPEMRQTDHEAGVMPRTVPILPVAPGTKELNELRPTTRLSWSKAIVDQAQRGEAVHHEPVCRASDVRPVRSQAAARARAGMAFQPVTSTVDPLPAPVINVNSAVSAPLPSELVSELTAPEQMSLPVEVPETAWTRIRKGFGSLLGVFHRG